MSSYGIEKLMSQAEEKGVTLANMISTMMSSDEIDRMQDEIKSQMTANYQSIRDFMNDVEVPSLAELSEFSEDELQRMQDDIAHAMSDELSFA
ncbi:MAG: hypothetical protein KKE24_00445 [Candidatus Thermoplasmatota archaeon]|nr:hypothetical protein [Candidatus Thermoplasmatota archaeon]